MFCTYILKSQKNFSFYIGSCKNVEKRLRQHNAGLVRSTKRYKPWNLMHLELYSTLSEARRREVQIKSWKNRKAVESLISKFNFEDPR